MTETAIRSVAIGVIIVACLIIVSTPIALLIYVTIINP
jgi:hypothetical protein